MIGQVIPKIFQNICNTVLTQQQAVGSSVVLCCLHLNS